MTSTLPKLVLASLAALAVGCGAAASDTEQVRATVRDWARAMADDHSRACRLMTRELKAELMRINGDLGSGTCTATLDAVMALSSEEERAALRRTRASIAAATARSNAAPHRVAVTRARCHPETETDLDRKRQEGKSTRDAIRCLKRHLTRRIWHLLHPPSPTEISLNPLT